MENTRRQFDRSLSREPGPKKPRLADDIAASDRSSNMRALYMQRQVPSNSGSGARIQRERDSDSSDSSRRPSQLQQSMLPHLDLVNQYKGALSELTFNSKPIITNLTIIAGENLHAAKAIASTVCNHILEVSKEQKLPSLYLLDSIVKNIGRDYIKYFALRLPEVFCKAYRQVDPSIHQGMRHLFGTWRGVFPPEPLHIIQKELGFPSSANGSSSGITTRPDAQTQRPTGHAHSIHVNPKYLEARGSAGDISEALLDSHEVEGPGRPACNKILQGRQGIQLFSAGNEKVSSIRYLDSEYGSSVSARSLAGSGRVKENLREQELDKTWYKSGNELALEKLQKERNGYGVKHGIEHYAENPPIKNPTVVTSSWKNSEEEEYAWDTIKAKKISQGVTKTADSFFKNSWASSDYEKEEFESYQQGPLISNDRESNIYDDPLSARTDSEVSETRGQFKNAMDYDEYLSSLDSSSKVGRIPFQSQSQSSLNGSQKPGASRGMVSRPSDNVIQQRQIHAGAPSSTLSDKNQRPPSPPRSVRNISRQTDKLRDHNRTSHGPPTDPRKAASLRSTGSPDRVLQNSLPLPSREVHRLNAQKPKIQNVHTAPSTIPASQQKKHAGLSSQIRKIEVSELETSSNGRNLMSSQVSRSGSQSNIGSSSSGHSNPLGVDSPGQSINSSFLTGVKNVLIAAPSVSSSSKDGFQDVGLAEEDKAAGTSPVHDASFLQGLGEEEIHVGVSSPSNQVSSLLSSLMERGLISGVKSESPLSSSSQLNQEPFSQHIMRATASTSESSLQVARVETISSVENEPASSEIPDEELPDKAFDVFPQPTAEIKNLIGFEFKSDIIRNLHADVLADLVSDLPYKCNTCGIKLKLEDSLSKHMEWHTSREQNSMDTNSRTWYKRLGDWLPGDILAETRLDLVGEPDVDSESIEHAVQADESQIACVLCGEFFEDFYCQERNEWMFKGAVHLSIPMDSTSSNAGIGPIVHVNCNSEDFTQNLQILSAAKLVKAE